MHTSNGRSVFSAVGVDSDQISELVGVRVLNSLSLALSLLY